MRPTPLHILFSLFLAFSAATTFAADIFSELKVAIERDDASELQRILRTGADLSDFDLNHLAYQKNFTRPLSAAVHLAVVGGDISIVEQLIISGANSNLADGSGNTPLHLASKAGHSEIVNLLLTQAVKINQLNIAGESALQLARNNSKRVIESLLLAAGTLDSDKGSFTESNLLLSREVDYQNQSEKFSFFAISNDVSRLVTVETSNRISLFNPSAGLFVHSVALAKTPLQVILSGNQLILGYTDHLEIRALETLEVLQHYETKAAAKLIIKIANKPHLVYSDKNDVFSININTGEQNRIYSSWSLKNLNLSYTGDTLFIADSFSVTTFETANFKQIGRFSEAYIGS